MENYWQNEGMKGHPNDVKTQMLKKLFDFMVEYNSGESCTKIYYEGVILKELNQEFFECCEAKQIA